MAFYQRSPAFDEKERAVLAWADAVTRGAASLPECAADELRKFFGEPEIVELTLVVCVANFTNRFNDALGIHPDLG